MHQDYWFKRRRYGYGWTPSTMQGWLVIIAYLVIVIGSAIAFLDAPETTSQRELGMLILILLFSTAGLIKISYKKGPKPMWRWGLKKEDDPGEDF